MFSLAFLGPLPPLASISASSLSLSPCGHHSKSTTPSILILFLPCRPMLGSSYTLICCPGVTLATYLSSALHFNAGHCICLFCEGSSASSFVVGNVRRRLPDLTSHTAKLLPCQTERKNQNHINHILGKISTSSSGEKYCGPCKAPSGTTIG